MSDLAIMLCILGSTLGGVLLTLAAPRAIAVARHGWREGNARRDAEIARESVDDEWERTWP